MINVRSAAVAGMFYPRDPQVLREDVDGMLAEAGASPRPRAPKALIVPHAGYIYSGPVAASAYALIPPLSGSIERVILFGPAHRVAVRGLALPRVQAFSTPLGDVPIDAQGAERARHLPEVMENDSAHQGEHSLEVQLPFLQRTLGRFRIVPFAVGTVRAEDVAHVMDALWGGPETLVVVSSDLSHYHGYGTARRIDEATARQVLDAAPWLDHEQACGATPVNALLMCTAARRLRCELLDLRNSGDTAGERSRVVGYASFAFFEDEPRHDA